MRGTRQTHDCTTACVHQNCRQWRVSAPSPHCLRDFWGGRGCGERAGVRGLYFTRSEMRRSCPSPEGGQASQFVHYDQISHFWLCEVESERYGPLTPTLSPTVESSLKAVPIVGERGQNLTAAYFSDAHTHDCRLLVPHLVVNRRRSTIDSVFPTRGLHACSHHSPH